MQLLLRGLTPAQKEVSHDPRPDMDLRGFLEGAVQCSHPCQSLSLDRWRICENHSTSTSKSMPTSRTAVEYEGSVVGFDRSLEGLMIRKQRGRGEMKSDWSDLRRTNLTRNSRLVVHLYNHSAESLRYIPERTLNIRKDRQLIFSPAVHSPPAPQ